MSWRVAVLITAALTAFVLVVAGALAMRLVASRGGSEQGAAAGGATQATVPLRVVLQREQQYRERLEEANARLNRAYAQIRTLQRKLAWLSGQEPGYTQGMPEASTVATGERRREERRREERRREERWEEDDEDDEDDEGHERHEWDDD